MKRLLTLLMLFVGVCSVYAGQGSLNENPADIVGIYEVRHQGEFVKVSVTEDTDGTFRAQIIWIEDRLDDKGNVRLDTKNPDKSLRHIECDKIVLFSGMKYDSSRCRWSGAKIYDPTRGIRINAICEFQTPGVLRVRGVFWGISLSMTWKKVLE